MEEIVTVDGRRFKLTTDRPLTASEKERAIADIRSGKMANIRRVQTLQNQVCTTINMLAGAVGPNVAIQGITIGTVDCGTNPACPGDLTCTNPACTPPDALTVVITFANSGDQNGPATPKLSVNGIDIGIIPNEGVTITVPAGGIATATFTGVTLVAGPNNVCASWT